jgi:propionyl-CoA carboxylase alpha chain
VQDAGLTWIGPTPDAIAAMGDKLEAKRRMAPPASPSSPAPSCPVDASTPTSLAAIGADVGFPLMVKAAAGGGGKGMRVVEDPADLADAVDAARREAAGAFGDGTVFLERFVTSPRHVEVQVLGDVHGTVVHAFERECSVQRRHQKVVEETPSPGIDDEVRAALCAAAVDAAAAIGYVNAGTVEFIADEAKLAARRAGGDVDPRDCFAFLEVNTRLQVEHPVTEQVVHVLDPDTGSLEPLDLVRCQLLVAAGAPAAVRAGRPPPGRSRHRGAPVRRGPGGRVPARDRDARGVRPATGRRVRWDTGVVEGDTISVHYDPMIAKVIATAPTRAEAAARLARALDDTVLVGAVTNRDLLVDVLRDPEASSRGETTTAYLADRYPDDADAGSCRTTRPVDLAVLAPDDRRSRHRADVAPASGRPPRLRQRRHLRPRGHLRRRRRRPSASATAYERDGSVPSAGSATTPRTRRGRPPPRPRGTARPRGGRAPPAVRGHQPW